MLFRSLAESIEKDCQPDVAMFNLFRVEMEAPEPKPKSPSHKYSCGCTEFRTKAEVVATCNKEACGNRFAVVE